MSMTVVSVDGYDRIFGTCTSCFYHKLLIDKDRIYSLSRLDSLIDANNKPMRNIFKKFGREGKIQGVASTPLGVFGWRNTSGVWGLTVPVIGHWCDIYLVPPCEWKWLACSVPNRMFVLVYISLNSMLFNRIFSLVQIVLFLVCDWSVSVQYF